MWSQQVNGITKVKCILYVDLKNKFTIYLLAVIISKKHITLTEKTEQSSLFYK